MVIVGDDAMLLKIKLLLGYFSISLGKISILDIVSITLASKSIWQHR